MIIETIIKAIIVSIFTQYSVQGIKKCIKIGKGYAVFGVLNIKVLLSVIIATLLCIFANIDILTAFGISLTIPFLGNIVTGLICSSGANNIRDLTKKIQEFVNGFSNKEDTEVEESEEEE